MSSSSESSIKLANLDLVRIISSSHRSIVRQFHDHSTSESYALKEFIRPISAINHVQIYRENHYLYYSESPYIVKYHCNFEEGDNFKIVLEYVHGGHIGSLGRIPEPILSKLAQQILLGLNYLHSKRIIHGNINPENNLINCENQIKICGLGNSRVLPGETVIFEGWKGTLFGYKCPEKNREKSSNGYANDIWGFVMTLLHYRFGSHRSWD